MKRTSLWSIGEAARELCSSHHAIPSIFCFTVCTSLTGFGRVVDLSRVPRCFPQRSTPSRTQGTFVGQGSPSVREYWPLRILLHLLSLQEVGL